MTIDEAVRDLEALFTVHHEAGAIVHYKDQYGEERDAFTRDTSVAPCGDPYVTLTSYGVDTMLPADAPVMFQSEGLAVRWWFDEAMDYAKTVEADKEQWSKLNLYWKRQPEFHATTYLAMDQGSLHRTSSPLAAIFSVDLGFARAELLISKRGPDGKEA